MVVFILNNFEGYRCSDYHIIFGELWRLVDQPMAFSGLCGHEGGRMVQALVQGYKSLVLCFYFPIYPSRPALRLWRGLRCDPGNDLYRGGERQAEWTLPGWMVGPTDLPIIHIDSRSSNIFQAVLSTQFRFTLLKIIKGISRQAPPMYATDMRSSSALGPKMRVHAYVSKKGVAA